MSEGGETLSCSFVYYRQTLVTCMVLRYLHLYYYRRVNTSTGGLLSGNVPCNIMDNYREMLFCSGYLSGNVVL